VLGAVGEGATGVVLMLAPAMVVRLLLGAELAGVGVALGRLTGFALLALAVACWPDTRPASRHAAALRALLTYSLLVPPTFSAWALAGRSLVACSGRPWWLTPSTRSSSAEHGSVDRGTASKPSLLRSAPRAC